MHSYKTEDVCSKQIDFDIRDGKLYNVKFHSGCNGNLQGIGVLVEGMNVDDAINKLRGIQCGGRNTSCPDQLAIALAKQIKSK